MECYCDFDEPEVFEEKFRVARKAYKCCECHEPILPGERYLWTKGLWDGDWRVFHTCECCEEDRKQLESAGMCWTYGGLQEEWGQLYDGSPKMLKGIAI